jgi:hypothetical protein
MKRRYHGRPATRKALCSAHSLVRSALSPKIERRFTSRGLGKKVDGFRGSQRRR